MKALILLKTSEGATWAYRQIKVLIARGIDVAVCLPAGVMFDRYIAEGIKVYELSFSAAPARFFKTAAQFSRIIKDYQPDIIHSHFFITTLFVRLYRLIHKLSAPLVFQVPGPLHLEHWLFRQIDLLSSGKKDYWIATCNWTKSKYLSSGIEKNRVFLSYYGTDLSFIRKQEPGKLRKELRLDKDDFIVAMVAYMYAPKHYLGQKNGLKGHEDFLEAVAVCSNENKRVKAVVIGGAWEGAAYYEEFLNKKGKELCGDQIYFLGTRNDVPELYADIDLVVHPSYSENLGGAAESLLLEVPTITSNVGGFTDIVVNGETGYLVNAGRPLEIAEAIRKSINDYEAMKTMALNGSRKLRMVLDVERTGKEVAEIYGLILSAKTNRH